MATFKQGSTYTIKGKTAYNHHISMNITVTNVDGQNITFRDSVTEAEETQSIEGLLHSWEVVHSFDIIGEAITEPEQIEEELPEGDEQPTPKKTKKK